jgi:alkylation response protein AidB-like acyl-CoA dehydrogenase/GNAT superfamily N-acetyltransferase
MAPTTDPTELFERFRRLAESAVRPRVRRHDDEHLFDRDGWRTLAQADFCRVPIRREFGGLGLGLCAYAAALEGVADGSGDLGFTVSAVAHMVGLMVLEKFGTPQQHQLYLPRLLSGEWIAAVANAEAQAGTNLMAIASQARRAGDGFELTADKRSITNVGIADLVLCSARLRDAPPRKEVNIFLVETATPGVETRTRNNLAGLRSSCTGDLEASQTRLPGHSLLGGVGQGLEIFREMFLQERLFTGVLYLSALRACVQRAVEHAETRLQFGRLIGRNQYVQDRIMRMRVAEELLAALLHSLLGAVERGEDVSEQPSILKVHGVEAALTASADLVRLLGGRGVARYELAEKYHRDLLALSILGGTVELHKIVLYGELARNMLARLAAVPVPQRDVPITVHAVRELDEQLERSLVELTARLFPDQPALRGRFYYDTRPDHVVVAWKDGKLAGFRVVTQRLVDVGPGRVPVAGLGIGVAPEFQKQGIGTALTGHTLELLRDWGEELALAFLWNPAAERLLQKFGFRRLQAKVSYRHRDTGELVVEGTPALALDLTGGTLLDDLHARGSLHLGLGAW